MFGSKEYVPVITRETELVPYEKSVTIHEHRAPTDDSVKLLQEMEEAAEKKFLGRFPLEGNWFKGDVVAFLRHAKDDTIYLARGLINGHEVTAEASVKRGEERQLELAWDRLRDAFAQKLAREMLAEPMALAVAQVQANKRY